jgi:hypothetical protein
MNKRMHYDIYLHNKQDDIKDSVRAFSKIGKKERDER